MAVGAYLVLATKRPRVGIAIFAAAAAYFAVVKFVVMPTFGKFWYAEIYKNLFPKGDETFGGVIKTLVSNPLFTWQSLMVPEKIVFFLQILINTVNKPISTISRKNNTPMRL